ncbi:hypothetical protein BH10BDE1_BH10BDE1_13760 [soil metagenome]
MSIFSRLLLLSISTFVLGCSAVSGFGSASVGISSLGSSLGTAGDPTGFKLTCEEARFVTLLNLYRQSQRLNVLKVSQNAVHSCRFHAQDMIDKNYFSHTEPDGRDFSGRAASFNYGAWAENIAAGYASGSATFCQWKNSPGHDANMRGSHKTVGIGRASGGGQYGVYWSNNYGPSTNDTVAEPLTIDADCPMPTALPTC